MEKIIHYIRSHRQQYLEELFQLLRIPSVSTAPEHAEDVAKCGQTLAEYLQAIGMTTVEIMPTGGHPVVYAEWLEAAGAPTILIYGHYDVQPPEPLEQWDNPPFEPEIRDGEIYARGASDDKGQVLAHLKAVEAYLKGHGKLPLNVKFLIEGEEEIGSKHLHTFVKQHAERLRADAIIISDTTMFAPGVPTICYGTRGLVALQIDLQGSLRDLHSGGYGGIVANPIQVLADILSALKDQDGRITIPGFYEDVVEIREAEKQQFEALSFDEEQLKKELGIPELFGEKGFTILERRWARPTLDVNGIVGGFTGEGVKTIIPAKAMAKITMRLVPNQNPEKIVQAFKEYVRNLTPPTVTLKITGGEVGAKPYLTPLDHPVLSFVSEALKKIFDRDPVFVRTGGSIGVVETFSDVLRVPVVFVALNHPGDNAHAPNEHLNEEAFYTGIEVAAQLLNELKAWKPE
jgi:acetylornithine deacetylase/succinyl-diaminopimelate desuccinylase-like protein